MAKQEKRKINWWSVSSCYGGEIGCDLGGTKSVPKRIWRRIVGKKKTVPEPIVDGVPTSDVKKEKNHKVQEKPVDKLQKSTSNSLHTSTNQSKPLVQQTASKCDYRTEPAPLYKMLDPVKTQTQTRLSHSDSPLSTSPSTKNSQRKPIGDFDPTKGLSVLTVIIALVLLFGRGFAIVCVCVWFYVVSRLKSDEKETKMKMQDKEVDLDSEEYKKKVVLRGFLERDKKPKRMNNDISM